MDSGQRDKGEGEQMKLLYGTGNAAKLEVMKRVADRFNKEAGQGIVMELLGLREMDREPPSVPEEGENPLENARQKALAYYDFYGIPVFSCDSGLYFEGVPEELQPGVHVRTVNGTYLTDEEMQAYYAGLAKTYGDLRARYQNAICLVLDRTHIWECMDESLRSEKFLIKAVPWGPIRQKGFPLDCLSADPDTGKYFYELEDRREEQLAVEEGLLDFFRKISWAL